MEFKWLPQFEESRKATIEGIRCDGSAIYGMVDGLPVRVSPAGTQIHGEADDDRYHGYSLDPLGQWCAQCGPDPSDEDAVSLELVELATGRKKVLPVVDDMLDFHVLPAGGGALLLQKPPRKASHRLLKVWVSLADHAAAAPLCDIDNIEEPLVVSPDGRHVALRQPEGNVALWDVQARTEKPLLGREVLPFSLAFSADGRRLAASGYSKLCEDLSHGEAAPDRVFAHVQMWDVASGQSQGTGFVEGWKEKSQLEGQVGLSADGATLAAFDVNFGDGLIVWSTRTWQESRLSWDFDEVTQSDEVCLSNFTFSENGRFIIASSEGALRFLELPSGRVVASGILLDAGKEWLFLTPDGQVETSPGANVSIDAAPDVEGGSLRGLLRKILPPKIGTRVTRGLFASLLKGVLPR